MRIQIAVRMLQANRSHGMQYASLRALVPACARRAAQLLLIATLLLVPHPLAHATDGIDQSAAATISTDHRNPDMTLQCGQSDCARQRQPRLSTVSRFRPRREITINSPLLDALLQNTPGYSEGYPDGVPVTYAWCGGSYRPHANRAPPFDFTAVTGWGQVYPMRGGVTYQGQTPVVEIANAQTFVHLRARNEWMMVQHQTRSPLAGAHFVSDFSQNRAIPMMNRRSSTGTTSIGAPPAGYNSHFWIQARGKYNAASVDGVYVQMEIRTIDPQLHVVANVGADWWRDASAAFEDGFNNNPGAGMSNWLLLTPEWSTLRFYSVSSEALFAAPPPPLQQAGSPGIPLRMKRRFVAPTPCIVEGGMMP